MKGEVRGTFILKISCDLKKIFDDTFLDSTIEDIFEIVSNCVDMSLEIDNVDIDTEESFNLVLKYYSNGNYEYHRETLEEPSSFDSTYYDKIDDKKILEKLKEYNDSYIFRILRSEYPVDEEILY